MSPEVTESDLRRLLGLRRQLLHERATAASPAVAKSLESADVYLFLALSYLGYSAELFPEEARFAEAPDAP